MSLTTPPSVRELQKALYVKAKANPTYRFYALYDKIYRQDVLWWAWGCCRANGGSAGVDGESFAKIEARGVEGWLEELAQELRTASTNGLIGTHLIPACMDHGMPEVQGAGLLAMMGLFDLVGTTASGWLSDRFSNRWLLFTYYGLRGVSLLWLPQAFNPSTHRLVLFAVFYGLDWIATVPPTVALTVKIFGREKVGLIFGWIVASHQVGAGITAFFAGFIRSMEGSYDWAFLVSGAACVLTALGVLLIGREVPRKAPASRSEPLFFHES